MLADIVGHDEPLRILRRAVFTGRVTHGYLFVGPQSVGKALAALEFAKVLNCERNTTFASADEVDCCDECYNCTQMDAEKHPDFRILRPATPLERDRDEDDEDGPPEASHVELDGAVISVQQMAELVGGFYSKGKGSSGRVDVGGHVALKLARARRRVYIISPAEAMRSDASFSRLLKTLEEPPPNTTFILTSANPAKLPPTIISRCQVVHFRPVPAEVAASYLERTGGADPVMAQVLAALSAGRIGWADRILRHPEAMALRDGLLDMCESLRTRQSVECLHLGEKIIDTVERWWLATAPDAKVAEALLKKVRDRVLRTCFPDILDILASWFRDLILASAAPDAPQIANQDRRDALARLAPLYTPDGCRKVCLYIEDLKPALSRSTNTRLLAEALALRMLTA